MRDDVLRLLPILNNSQIARETGLSHERVRQLRNKAGIPNPLYHKTCSIVTEEDLGKLIRLSQVGLSWKEIQKEIGFSIFTLRQHLKKLNISKVHPKEHPNVKYTKELLLQLYNKHNGNISAIARELKAHVPSIYRRYKQLGLKGNGHKESKQTP
jgi:DNA-binding NtrC family response regulator